MDWFLILTPFLLLGIVALFGFIGCDRVLGLTPVSPLPPPKIDSIDPTSGPPTGGTTVTIHGNDLAGTTEVQFGSADANIVSVDTGGGQVIVTSPPGQPGSVDVTASSGSLMSNSDVQFTYIAINFVQTNSSEQATTNPPIAVTLPNATARGNLLIAAVSYVGGTVTVSDNLGNPFTQVGSGPWVRQSAIFVLPNIPGGSVTITAAGAGGPCSMCVSEYSGADQSSPVYGFSTQKSSGGSAGIEVIEGISITLAQTSDVVYAVVFASKDSNLMGSGNFTAHAQPTTSLLVADSTMSVTAAQPVATDDTTGGTFLPWVILGLAIKA